jgi:hypothetical protein
MEILKIIIGAIATVIGLVIASWLLGFILSLLGIVLKLVWLAVIAGAITLVIWVIYKIFTSGRQQPV